jgi:hypothetical protein
MRKKQSSNKAKPTDLRDSLPSKEDQKNQEQEDSFWDQGFKQKSVVAPGFGGNGEEDEEERGDYETGRAANQDTKKNLVSHESKHSKTSS